MEHLKKYIVTLKSKDDLHAFYHDMECDKCSKECIPNRAVECCLRRDTSRNTVYFLSDDEANILCEDERVLAVERIPEEVGIHPMPMFIQTESSWNKSSSNNTNHKNWGLLRVSLPEQIQNWGSDDTPNQSGTIVVNAEGRDVDVVIVDGFFNPNHPEFLDEQGNTRVIQYNWFQHSLGQSSGQYVYPNVYDNGDTDYTADNNHGAHVAGTVVGLTQGWARKSNIYNINPYSTDVNQTSATLLIDYIREFHNNKPINQKTGRRNPTICNHSWGYGSLLEIQNITTVVFKGQQITGPFTEAQLNSYGIFTRTINGTVFAARPARVTAVDADMEDAIADGIIMVGAAGNDRTKIDVIGGPDYDNFFVWNGFGVPYHRGSTPGSSGNTICVGAISTLKDETKAIFSNCGPRVNIYAPGEHVKSSLNSTTSYGGVADPNNNSFVIGKLSGTSMASPQVCGVLACVLETYPNMTQIEAIEYINHYGKSNQILDTNGSYTDYTSLQGSQNLYVFYFQERLNEGNIFPKNNLKARPSSGGIYPRTRIRRKG